DGVSLHDRPTVDDLDALLAERRDPARADRRCGDLGLPWPLGRIGGQPYSHRNATPVAKRNGKDQKPTSRGRKTKEANPPLGPAPLDRQPLAKEPAIRSAVQLESRVGEWEA